MKNPTKTLTTPELWAQFNQCLRDAAGHLARLAELWSELDSRGEDMSSVNTPILQFLPEIAKGSLDPNLVVLYGGDARLVHAMAKLVPEDQAKLTKPAVKLSILTETVDGEAKIRLMRPTHLTPRQIDQVFGDGRIRTPAEQKKYLPSDAALPNLSVNTSSSRRAAFNLWAALRPEERELLESAAEWVDKDVANYIALDLRRNLLPKLATTQAKMVKDKLAKAAARAQQARAA